MGTATTHPLARSTRTYVLVDERHHLQVVLREVHDHSRPEPRSHAVAHERQGVHLLPAVVPLPQHRRAEAEADGGGGRRVGRSEGGKEGLHKLQPRCRGRCSNSSSFSASTPFFAVSCCSCCDRCRLRWGTDCILGLCPRHHCASPAVGVSHRVFEEGHRRLLLHRHCVHGPPRQC